jgi:hypothetical protein
METPCLGPSWITTIIDERRPDVKDAVCDVGHMRLRASAVVNDGR